MTTKRRNKAMASSGITAELDEREKQLREDYEWVLHDTTIQRQQAGKVIAVHKKKIWGAGASHAAALTEALQSRDCPRRQELALVYVEGRSVG
jgi:hypothetical protein